MPTDQTAQLFIRNVPFHLSEEEIKDLLALRFSVISVTRPKHEDGEPRGFCFAEVPREELGKALACDGMDMGGRQVHIEEATSRSKP